MVDRSARKFHRFAGFNETERDQRLRIWGGGVAAARGRGWWWKNQHVKNRGTAVGAGDSLCVRRGATSVP